MATRLEALMSVYFFFPKIIRKSSFPLGISYAKTIEVQR